MHSNSNILYVLLNSYILGNKKSQSLRDIQFDYNSYKFGKNKTLPFLTHRPNGVF